MRHCRRRAPRRRDRAGPGGGAWRRARAPRPGWPGVWRSPGGDVLLVHTAPRDHRSRPVRRAADGHARRPSPHRLQRRGLQLPRAAAVARSARRAVHHRQRHRSAAAPAGLRRPGRAGAGPRDVRAGLVGRRRHARCCSPAIGSASSRCMSPRPADRSRSRPRFSALVASGLVERTVDPAGVLGYLAWGTVPPSLTWVAGVESLAAGHMAAVRSPTAGACQRSLRATSRRVHARPASGAHRIRRCGSASAPPCRTASPRTSSPMCRSASSSRAASIRRRFCRPRSTRAPPASTPTPCASTIARPSTSTRGWSRRPSAPRTTSSSSIRRESSSDLPRILRHLDQPTLDAVNSFYVSAAVAETGIKAVLSGTGGDELFGGYPSFRRLPAALPPEAALGADGAGGRPGRVGGAARAADRALAPFHVGQRPASMRRIVRSAACSCPPSSSGWPVPRCAIAGRRPPRASPPRSRALFDGAATTLEGDVARLETRVYLGSQLLRDLDVMSMAHGARSARAVRRPRAARRRLAGSRRASRR